MDDIKIIAKIVSVSEKLVKLTKILFYATFDPC